MTKIIMRDLFRPPIIFFIAVNALCLCFAKWLDVKGIDHIVLMYANLVLFLLTLFTGFIHMKALSNNNPFAFVRSVTASSFIKLVVISATVLIYLFTAAENRNIYAVAAAMLLYIVYTVMEVTGAMRMNRKKNVNN